MDWIRDNVGYMVLPLSGNDPQMGSGNHTAGISKVNATYYRCSFNYEEVHELVSSWATFERTPLTRLVYTVGLKFSFSDIDPLSITRVHYPIGQSFEIRFLDQINKDMHLTWSNDIIYANVTSGKKVNAYLKYSEVIPRKSKKKSQIDMQDYKPQESEEKRVSFAIYGVDPDRFERAFRHAVKLCGGKVDPF